MADIDFQPEQAAAPIATPPPTPAATPTSISFTPEAAAPTPAPTNTPAPQINFQPEQPTAQAPKIDFQPENPVTPPKDTSHGYVSDDEMQQIAGKHNVDPSDLKNIAPYWGVETQGTGGVGEAAAYAAKGAAGVAGEMALGIPQFVYKHTQSDDMQDAIDEVHQLSESRKTKFEKGMEMGQTMVAPLPVFSKYLPEIVAAKDAGVVAKTAAAAGRIGVHATEGATIGGVAGYANAPRGQEVQGAEQGAKFGAVLGGVISTAGEASGGIGNVMAEARRANPEATIADVNEGAQKIADATQDSEKILNEIATGNKTAFNDDDAATIVGEQMDPEDIDKALDPGTPQGRALRERAGEGNATSEAGLIRQMADDIATERVESFAKELNPQDRVTDTQSAVEAIDDYTLRQGGDRALQDKWNDFVQGEQAARWQEASGTITDQPGGFFTGVANKLSANKFVLRHLDDKYNVGAESALQDISQAKNRLTYARNTTRQQLADSYNLAQKNKISDDVLQSRKLFDAGEDTTKYNALSPGEQKLVDSIKKNINGVRDYANGGVSAVHPDIIPLSIPSQGTGYMPHMVKSMDQLVPVVEQKLDEALATASSQTGRNVTNLGQLSRQEFAQLQKSGAVADLEDFANFGRKSKVDYTRPGDLGGDLNRIMYTTEGNLGLESSARAAMARTGHIPSWMQETNLFRVADSYAHNTLNHLYLRKGLDKLNTVGDKLENIGADPEAEYVRTIARDTMGIRPGTAAAASKKYAIWASSQMDRIVNKYGEWSVQGMAARTVSILPKMIDWASSQLYNNVLGFNPHSVLMHVGTSVARIPAEIGGTYGAEVAGKGALRVTMSPKEIFARAQELGNIPAHYIRGAEDALKEGLAATLPARALNAGIDGIGQVGMYAFQKGEQWNRSLVVGMSDVIAEDLAARSPNAVRTIESFPRFVQEQVAAARGDVSKTSDAIARYLNDTAIFNYNRTSMFEYGRTMGKFFSTFSTWPTSMYGEALYTMRSKGILLGSARSLERLAAPYTALAAVGYAVHGGTSGMSDREKEIFGAKGLGSVAPAGALKEFASGKLMTPPAIDMVYQGLVKPVLDGDPHKLQAGLSNAIQTFGPASGAVKFVTDTVPTMVTGRRPQGKNFIERTKSSVNNGIKFFTK